jgi:hypothetical protein
VKGKRVLAQMLGVGAGRFTVMNSVVPIEAELDGNLAAQLAKPIARARAATALLTSSDMKSVERVLFDEGSLDDYLRATPERARSIARRLAKGETPRQLVLDGACEGSLLEDVMTDLAARGVVTGAVGDGDKDLMGPLMAHLMTQSDARASFAPNTLTPAPEGAAACTVDAQPLCTSPAPSPVDAPASLDDAVMREINKSPKPAQLALPLAEAAGEEPSASPAPVALAEPTMVDSTVYGREDGGGDDHDDDGAPGDGDREGAQASAEAAEDIPVDEASRALGAADMELSEGTPFAAVTGDDVPAGVPEKKAKAWPMVAFVAATAGAVWAVLHLSSGNPDAPKQVETAPPPQAETALPTPKADKVSYAPVAGESDVPAGQGVLDVSAPAESTVVVDGSERGKGVAKLPLSAGSHDVRIKSNAGAGAADDACTVEVRAGRVARVKF